MDTLDTPGRGAGFLHYAEERREARPVAWPRQIRIWQRCIQSNNLKVAVGAGFHLSAPGHTKVEGTLALRRNEVKMAVSTSPVQNSAADNRDPSMKLAKVL